MFYDVDYGPFELKLTNDLKRGLPDGLVHLKGDQYRLSYHDEGFYLEDLEKHLECATGLHRFRVSFSDHKGSNSYEVVFGPDYCSEVTEDLPKRLLPADKADPCLGRGWLLSENTDTGKHEVQRCDHCQRYPDDAEAGRVAKSALAFLGV